MADKKECSNKYDCPCPYTSCENYALCCECVNNHRNRGDLPNCLRGE